MMNIILIILQPFSPDSHELRVVFFIIIDILVDFLKEFSISNHNDLDVFGSEQECFENIQILFLSDDFVKRMLMQC